MLLLLSAREWDYEKESDDIVSANGSFLISDELKALDAESITMLFEEMNVTVRNIEK